ncbi:MAG TPA: bifunctional helix-turn-helix domain-containing protein/methylated-DNA--[protein]-cysteine S-methyltransferase, partial [Aestuariivirga sp.]
MSQLEDYNKVRAVLEHLHEGWRTQPSLAELASPVGLSEDQLQKLFTRWAGLTPKAFLQALTLDHARAMLQDSASILDTALDLGLSGPGRLHDLFIAHEAMSPGAYKSKGAGLTIYYGFYPSPFGIALAMVTSHGLCGLSFNDDGGDQAALADMKSRWPNAQYTEDSARTAPYVARIFGNIKDNQPIRITMIGSDFEISVWETLLKIPLGKAVAYSDIATAIGKPKAARAVGAAVGRNPISFVVPCHRALGKSGALTGYHWGLTSKKAILGWEAGRLNS